MDPAISWNISSFFLAQSGRMFLLTLDRVGVASAPKRALEKFEKVVHFRGRDRQGRLSRHWCCGRKTDCDGREAR
jgi:hypothetical protein